MPEYHTEEWTLLRSVATERGWSEAFYSRALRSLMFNSDIPTRRLHKSRFAPVLVRRQDIDRLETFVQAPHRARLDSSRLQIASRFSQNALASRQQPSTTSLKGDRS